MNNQEVHKLYIYINVIQTIDTACSHKKSEYGDLIVQNKTITSPFFYWVSIYRGKVLDACPLPVTNKHWKKDEDWAGENNFGVFLKYCFFPPIFYVPIASTESRRYYLFKTDKTYNTDYQYFPMYY